MGWVNGNYQRILFHSVRTASADRVRRMAAPRRHLALVCFLYQANWTRGDRKARFEQTAERHAGLSQFAAPFLSRMKFVDEQGEGTSPTLSALRVYREHRAAGRRGVPPDAPLDFAPAALQPLIRRDGVTDRRRWESALFLKVRDEIRTGNLAIDGAKNFGRFEAFFLPSAQWE